MVEGSGQPTKLANKILVSIFLTMKATILDTHSMSKLPWLTQTKEINLKFYLDPLVQFQRWYLTRRQCGSQQ